jgi:Uma2 family endonuclease
MDVHEFLRRYAADPAVVSAELLQGVVHITRWRDIHNSHKVLMPPISARGHALPDNHLQTIFGFYAAHTPGVQAMGPLTTILPSATSGVEPDAQLRVQSECGGVSTIAADKLVHGTPELVAGISFHSGAHDFGKKFDTYEAEGVPEYLIWRTAEQEVHWFTLKRKKYLPLSVHADGTLRSEQFPGLWLDVPALLQRGHGPGAGHATKGDGIARTSGVCNEVAQSRQQAEEEVTLPKRQSHKPGVGFS